MSHYLRCGLQSRLPKFLFEAGSIELQRSFLPLSRLLATSRVSPQNAKSENTSAPSKQNDEILSDYTLFHDEIKIALPKSAVVAEEYSNLPLDDPDNFGTLSKSNDGVLSLQEGSEDDEKEDMFTSELPNYYPQKTYADQIKKLLRQRRFADALDVLQVTMLKEHRVKPEYYIYSILIAYCGTTGYSKMAFQLYNDMKKRGLPVKSSVYTSLFNSYANSPYPSDGLKRTRHLFSLMNEKGIHINQITCHAIIKAFARCGSVEESFKLVDYMMDKKMRITKETMSFLFQACVSDKTAGFRHALLVYKKMIQYRMTPDVFQFNLLLRCVRDCGLGDFDSTIDALRRIGVENIDELDKAKSYDPPSEGYPWEEDAEICAMTVAGTKTGSELLNDSADSSVNSSPRELLPDLFARKPTLGCVVSLMQIEKPEDRLFLLGGAGGFLREMSSHEAKPDIKTFSLLLECIPQTLVAEETLLKSVTKEGLKVDVLFFNTLIKRRVYRAQYSEAKDVLSLIASHGLQPDLMTYTNLAMTCRKTLDAYELLKAMDASGLRPNIEFITAMLGCAVVTYNIRYINLILDVIDYEEIPVNTPFLKKADSFYQKCLRVLEARPEKFTPAALDSIKNFCKKYPEWKASVPLEEKENPWQYLRDRHQESETDKEFLGEHVENHSPVRAFTRLGPNTAPKVRLAKKKKLKEENPEAYRKPPRRETLEALEGIPHVTYQALQPK
ncbi:Pentatricopeptide repeat-containing protein 1, mitochondrial [Frankliniella fusca]|uniref:Pentatricopeptide repeat-containing protein 1, mitochondrial n=1 Tax=Frankliniella fusca TaxID=407009 RepID=A0AAE1I037_9NEOP|nr:Pentatricopeptide repeat-containing protein 1, mitochondrial [Frankliniella fusca]